ncbi:MAG: OmpA family protein [Polyangiaceae bacterium]
MIWAAFTLIPGIASAQGRGFYLDRLIVAGAPDDSIALWRPSSYDKVRFFGQFGLGFTLNPLRSENYTKSRVSNPVDTQTTMYLDVGVQFLKRVQFLVAMPVILVETTNPTVGNLVAGGVHSAPMDLRLEARVMAWQNDARTFRLGFNAAVIAPSGDEGLWGGEGSASGILGTSLDYDFKSGYATFNTGFLFRPRSDLNSGGLVVGNDWRYGLGVFFPLRGGSFLVGGSVFGSASIEPDAPFAKNNSTLEWLGEGKMALDEKKRLYAGFGGGTRLVPGYAPDMRLVATIGYHFPISDTAPPAPPKQFKIDDGRSVDTDHDGLPDDIDLCPTEPEDHKPPNPDDGCPAPPDRDGDGIPDSADQCPDQPEDFDKIEDQDGCPEDDFDKDGVADAVDACPKEPGEPSGEKDKNGCPVFIRRLEGSTEIQILKQVQFATGSAKILSNSFKILDEVVRLMTVNKDIKLVAIEGHTDDRGAVSMNEKLSDDRANSVRQYLIDHGIHPDRLTAKGFGPHKPIADNKTADGRQKNRRVEFHIRDNLGGADQPDGSGTETPQ